MNQKPTIHKTSVAVAIVLGQLAFGNVAQARAVDDWGYWDAPTAAGPNSGGTDSSNFQASNTTSQNNGNRSFNGDQRVLGVNPDVLIASADQTGFVGYTLCYYGCDGGLNNDYYNRQPQTAGTVSIEYTQGAERMAERSQYVGEIYYWTEGKPYYVSNYKSYDADVAVNGTFNGAAFNLNDSQSTIAQNSVTYYWGDTYSNSELRAEVGNKGFNAGLSGEGERSPVRWGNIYANNAQGTVMFGKPVAVAQIAEQLRLGQTYNFYGSSYNSSSVQIAVNFQNASWSGSWGKSYDYNNYDYQNQTYKAIQNGFTAAGGISGSTLTSSSVVGAGNLGVGFVTGGKVDATLVGAIVGTDASASAVIGKTIVNVQQAVGVTTVADIFQAQAQREIGCKGGCD
jgi:hypothetical protein